MVTLVAVCGLLVSVAAIFMIEMIRRDEPFLGLIALIFFLTARIPALIYAGLDSG